MFAEPTQLVVRGREVTPFSIERLSLDFENRVNRKGFSLTPKGLFADHRWILRLGWVGKGWKRGESKRV